MRICWGKVSMEWPGTNHVVLMPKRSNSLTSRGVPTSPENMPREMSSGESSPPYDPSQPATASTSTPNAHRISLAMGVSRLSECGHTHGPAEAPGEEVDILGGPPRQDRVADVHGVGEKPPVGDVRHERLPSGDVDGHLHVRSLVLDRMHRADDGVGPLGRRARRPAVALQLHAISPDAAVEHVSLGDRLALKGLEKRSPVSPTSVANPPATDATFPASTFWPPMNRATYALTGSV